MVYRCVGGGDGVGGSGGEGGGGGGGEGEGGGNFMLECDADVVESLVDCLNKYQVRKKVKLGIT